ncbi:putative quinol monooxygenase [Nonlabens antarcticus]|uniref:putative quinol monooxygenase n=1 Tax=Nonlabens antarcticus TaxID=392714 RepID=UPI001890DAD8|nr:antibiotic biosynthesis monooxygenase family protein [Nonlabens antarcticus]
MIVRIVKMHFQKDRILEFQTMFEDIKEGIRNQPGCSLLELYQDIDDKQAFYTYSYWDSEADLNNYRHSALFKKIWPATKAMFDEKPTAHSVHKIHSLK